MASVNREVSSSKEGSNALKPIFDKEEIENRTAIAAAFTRELGSFLNNRAKEADEAKRKLDDAITEERSKPLALTLQDVFEEIMNDVDKVLYGDKRFVWPSIPEGYQIPQYLLAAGADPIKRVNGPDDAAGRDGLMLSKGATGEIVVIGKDRIDAISKTFIELAESIGDTREEMDKAKDENDHFEWRIDYNSSLGDRLERYLDQLFLSVEVHRIATHKSEHLAAYQALKDAGTHARSISGLFGDIKADVHKVCIFDERFAWPDIPDDYRFPEHLVMSGACLKRF